MAFSLPEVEGLERDVKGLPADLAIDIWRRFGKAMESMLRDSSSPKLTTRQIEMAVRASMRLGACEKIGLDALIDEATGAQYDRASEALRGSCGPVVLRAYLEDEMRKWEKTFPDELWLEFKSRRPDQFPPSSPLHAIAISSKNFCRRLFLACRLVSARPFSAR